MSNERVHLNWRIDRHEHFRTLPRDGKPVCIWEWVTQTLVKVIAFLPVYTAIVVTFMLYLMLFGVPFIKGV